MRKIYSLFILIAVFIFPGCSKDFLKSYDSRIVGTWHITDINRIGFGGNTNSLAFTNGTFTFRENGSLTYVNDANVTYQGSWDIIKRDLHDQVSRTLQLTAIDFANQQVLSTDYDEMNFSGTNHFKATVHSGLHVFVTHFRR